MALSKTWSTPLFRTLCRENAKRLSDLGASPLKPPSHERKATVRLTEEELARLKEAARRAGWSQEAYLRALIGGIDPRPKPPPDYLAMTRELHAIGNNLNQIARKAHALGTVDAARYDAEARRLEAALREIVAAVKEPGRRR